MKLAAVILLSCACSLAAAQTKYLFTPKEGPVLDHPLAAEPGARNIVDQRAVFQQEIQGDIEVSLRITGGENATTRGTGFVVWLRNLSTDKVLTVRPTIDIVDASGAVMPIHNMGKLMEAARAGQLNQSESSDFFYAQGSQKFVANAYAGYAIGSLLSAAVRSSNNQKIAEQLGVWERHWLRSEYRIPPQAKVDVLANLIGIPRLPMTVRITVDDKVFSFTSVATLEEAAANYRTTRGMPVRPERDDACLQSNSCR